jgi:hypothetical protein
VLGSQVRDESGRLLDGDGDGVAGGDKVVSLFRKFGDLTGDGHVDALELFQFYTTFGKRVGEPGYLAAFDYDGSTGIDTLDLFQLYGRFGT